MDIKPLSDSYAVSPQITPEDLAAVKAAGFTTVINNRPDEEIPPDLQAEAMRQAVEAAGLGYVVNPVRHSGMTAENMTLQQDGMAGDGKVLAYCASGNRSAIVWSLLKAPELGADGVLSATRNAGYDHSQFRPHFEAAEKG
jgi:uncharacterized protein (TIGR01244 family)